MTASGYPHQRTTAWVVERPGPIGSAPLRRVERVLEEPGPWELLIDVGACGVCRTDLHLAEGDLAPHLPACTPGHEIVGRVLHTGSQVREFGPGDRVGAAWLAGTCGTCRYCRAGHENLCPRSRYTGWDTHGGYAGQALVDARYAYPLPDERPDEEIAPLLCAGIIGYRALERAQLPPGGRLGIYGYGASGHLTAQLALSRGASVHPHPGGGGQAPGPGAGRGLRARRLRDAARTAGRGPPLRPGGRSGAGRARRAGPRRHPRGGRDPPLRHPPLDYQQHLFRERSLRSVTANTREDGRAYLAEAARHRPTVHVQRYPMSHADTALADLAAGRVTGVAVLMAR